MHTFLNTFKWDVLHQILGILWRQWSAIGVPGYSDTEETVVVDPEALLLLTLTVARHDNRLFDQVLDWLGLTDPRQQRLDELLLASEWRRLARDMRPLLGEAGWGQPLRNDAAFKAETYAEVFIEDIQQLLRRLNRKSV